ncbi:hypothetical protein FDUTEX481_06864 [Tolypothrix sp. PCC 7601]|nr:hypothetical protein FDUTEX481_06864 [Tolypothrix sp. PCC 7601]
MYRQRRIKCKVGDWGLGNSRGNRRKILIINYQLPITKPLLQFFPHH